MTSYTYKTIPPEYRDSRSWREIDLSQMSESEKERFIRFHDGIENYLRTGHLSAASRIAQCTKSTLLRQLNRCLTSADDDQIFGWAGLIKHKRVKEYHRHQPLPTTDALSRGDRAGAFKSFLDMHPEIKKSIDALVLKTAIRRHVHEARIQFKNLARQFRNLCLKQGILDSEYPLNSKSQARQSVTRYAKEVITENSGRGTWARFGDGAWKHLNVSTGVKSFVPRPTPMKAWGLDAHKTDCIGCVIVHGPAGPQKIPIKRLWIVPTVDAGSHAVMGYSVGIRQEISAGTIEESLISATSQWEPRDFSESGLHYLEGAALPSYVYPELVGCAPSMIKFDNAVQHYATRIIEQTRKRFGASFCWGGIGQWSHNAIVERLFRSLENYGFHRMPSTTGSSPTDSVSRDAVKTALKLGIEWSHLLDLIDIIISEYNVTPNRGLGGQAPLTVLQNYLDPSYPRLLLRPLVEPTMAIPELGTIIRICTIRGSQRNGVKPYIETDGARYTNPLLANSFDMVGQKIALHLASKDVSHGNAFMMNGELLGELIAQGSWGQVAHSFEIRKEVGTLINEAAMWLRPDEDPIEQLMKFYAGRAIADSKKYPDKVSGAATKLTKLAHETGRVIPEAEEPISPLDPPPIRPLSGLVKSPSWKTVT